jgi:hypothetical protein
LNRILFTISGTISTDNPGGPASGATVQLKQGGVNVGTAVSSAEDGSYTIPSVPAGDGYTIEMSLTGYTTGTISVFSVSGNVSGKDLTLIKLTVPTYTISGTISTDNPEGPASGATVQLKQGGVNVGSAVSSVVGGSYTILSVPAGDGYTIEVSLTGYTTDTIPLFSVSGNVSGKDLTLNQKIIGLTGVRRTKTPDAIADAIDNEIFEIDFSITNLTAGASYQLQYRTIGDANQTPASLNLLSDVGAWVSGETKAVIGADVDGETLHIYYTPPNQRQGYQYRVIGSVSGKTSSVGTLVSTPTNTIQVVTNATIGTESGIYAYAVKGQITASGLSGPYAGGTITASYTVSSAVSGLGFQPGESISVYAQKETTDTSKPAGGQITIGAPIVAIGSYAAPAAIVTLPALGIQNAGVTAGTVSYRWVNVTYVITAK